MFIDEISKEELHYLWVEADGHPVKTARELFPNRPKDYVKITSLIKAYAINKFVALDIAPESFILSQQYIKIAADIYTQIPGKFKALPDKFFKREVK